MSAQESANSNAGPAVLVVGAGPAGLALALTLVKSGVPVRIINKAPTHHQEQRGTGIQPRTQEVFHFLGTLPDITEKMHRAQTIMYYKMPGSKVLSTTSFNVPEDDTPQKPFNNIKFIPQYQTEGILRSHLEKYGYPVELATELVSFQQYDDRVEATIKKSSPDGKETTETKSYRWLVGADGGRSTVRKQCGLSFEGSSTHERWVLGEIYIEGLDPEVLHWYNWLKEDGSMDKSVFIRNTQTEPGRFLFTVAGNIDSDEIMASHVVYITDYRPSVRMVNKYSVGRIFVAGDAAHVHTPRGGQGLNSSVQDAFNLGWKLALVEKGLAPRALLETYTEERLPVIQYMLQETIKVSQRFAANLKKKTHGGLEHPTYLKQFGINYRWSSIVLDERAPRKPEGEEMDPYGVNSGEVLCAGDRAPNATGLVHFKLEGSGVATSLFEIFSPTRHTALIFGEDPARIASIVKGLSLCPQSTVTSVAVLASGSTARAVEGVDVTVQDRDGIAHDAYRVEKDKPLAVIVRPDGVVGAVVSGEEGVVKYFGNIFSGPTTA